MTIGFTGAALDRRDALRLDPAGVMRAMITGQRLVTEGLAPVVGSDGGLLWEQVAGVAADDLILLGFEGERALFAPLVADGPVGQPRRLLPLIGALAPRDAALWGAACSLNQWHARHRFCGVCGAPTMPFRAGWGRVCAMQGHEHFPRVDPVVIMLAEHDGKVLVGRQPAYPPGRYSALAGFVEPGESIEEAVARELMEEAGIAVTNVRYVASQPWPFPGQLMIGCLAVARDTALTIDRTEMDDAKWVDRAGVRAALGDQPGAPFLAPPPIAIAHHLLEAWLATET